MLKANMELEVLEDLFKSAWLFLKNTHTPNLYQQQHLIDLPWYLLIGPSNSGKTRFVTQTRFNFIEAPQFNLDPQDESDEQHRCNWWFTDKMTILDVPGNYLTAESTAINWQQFLKILQPYQQRKPLNGIILTLNLTECATQSKTEQKKLAQQLRDVLYVLSKQINARCPLYLVLTKADKIAGFNEFFADLGQEEREQVWGVNLAQATTAGSSSLPRLFKNQYEQLIKRLQERVIWRLHHERNATKRALIQQFPLQLESCKNNLANLIYQLSDIFALQENLPLQGIYLVSSLQQDIAIDCLQKPLAQNAAFSANLTAFPSHFHKQQAYFTQQLFNTIIFNSGNLHSHQQGFSPQDKKRLSAYVLAVMFIASSGLVMAHNFNQRVANLNAAQADLAQYQVLVQQLSPEGSNLSQTLPALNSLQQAITLLNSTKLPWFSSQAHKLPGLANKTYQNALSSYFLPDLGAMLEQALTSSNDPNQVYGALKTYLMLGDPSRRNLPFIRNWFTQYWTQIFANNAVIQQQLTAHLNTLLTQPFNALELNQTILSKTRASLTIMPAPQLAYAILKSQTDNSLLNPITQSAEQVKLLEQFFSGYNITINSLFTVKQFNDIYNHQIIAAAKAVTKGDWVLGDNTRPVNNQNNLATLITQVRLLYLKDYANQWQILLSKLTLTPWKSWSQAKLSLDYLLGRNSPVIRLLQTVKANTSLTNLYPSANSNDSDAQFINANLSSQFDSINTYSQSADGKQSSGLNQSLVALKNLQNYIAPMANDKNNNETAFTTAKVRFQDNSSSDPLTDLSTLSATAPLPLHNWLGQITNNVWQLQMSSAAQYINHEWEKQVLPFYKTKLDNTYPLFKTATNDVDLDDFKKFFADNGILNKFFNEYLEPFIDTDQSQWQWHSLNGQTLNLGADVLPQFERAAIIRTMFFNKENQLNVKLSLQAISFEPGLNSFAFTLNGQTFTDENGESNIHAMHWPGDQASHLKLIFTSSQNQVFKTNEKDPWALFHLLDRSNLQPSDNTQYYQVTFDSNGNAVRYKLAASQLINPFIPGIIDQFRCPESLN